MKVKEVRSIQDAEQYCEGLLNDYTNGLISNGVMMSSLRDYTFHLHDMFLEQFEKGVTCKRCENQDRIIQVLSIDRQINNNEKFENNSETVTERLYFKQCIKELKMDKEIIQDEINTYNSANNG